MNEQTPSTIKCLDCDAPIKLTLPLEMGDVLVCDECGVELEIVNTTPAELDYLLVEK